MLNVRALGEDLEDTAKVTRGAVPPRFPFIARWEIAARNAWSKRRKEFRFDGSEVSFVLALRPVAPANISMSYIRFSAGDSCGAIALPPRLIEAVLESFRLAGSYPAREETILLLLEHRFSAALDALEKSIGEPVAIEEIGWQNPIEGNPYIRLDASLRLWSTEYPISFYLPPQSAPGLTANLEEAAPPRYRQPDATITAAFRLGVTRLTFGELRMIRPNDVILVDRTAGAGLISAVAGKFYQAKARYELGTVVLLEPLSRMTSEQGERGTMPNGGADAGAADASFNDLEIKIVFEVGRIELRLEELGVLGAGHVFELGKDARTAVDIYAGDRRIGFGEIVQINETLGVRVTRLFNNE
jgi:type III secretion protein Q